jgi:hypothetical protein
MKVLFEDSENETSLTVGVENNNKLTVNTSDQYPSNGFVVEINLTEAYKLQRQLSEFIREMEETERKKLPWHKRLF